MGLDGWYCHCSSAARPLMRCVVGLKKPSVLVAASFLCLIIGLGTPSLAQGRRGGTPGGPGASGPGGGGRGPGGPGAGGPGAGGPGRGGPGPGRGGPVRPPGGGYYRGYYQYPYYGYRYYGYPYRYGGYGYPYLYAGWGWPYGAYPYYYAYGGGYDASASLRLDVTPKEAEVYIDGYLAGTVDDFDGTLQRLHVPPGAHELTLYRDGFSDGSSIAAAVVRIHVQGLVQDGAVGAGRSRRGPSHATTAPSVRRERGASTGPREGRPGTQAPPRRPPPARSAAGFGTLAIRVQPADAIVLIDGERWQTSSGPERLVVDVPQGPHRIEIRKEGFDTVLERDHDVAGRDRTHQRQPAIAVGQR